MSRDRDIYNIGNIGNFAGNLGGQVGRSVTATSQNVGLDLEKVADLIRQMGEQRGRLGLNPAAQAKIDGDLEAINEELRGAEPKPGVIAGLLQSMKETVQGAAGNLTATGVISAIGNLQS